MRENWSSGFPITSDTNQLVESQKKVRSFKFGKRWRRNCIIRVAKTKVLISCAVTAFVFAYAKVWFSHDVAEMRLRLQTIPNKIELRILDNVMSLCFTASLCTS